MNINVSLYQPKRYTRWECHLENKVYRMIGELLRFTGETKEEAIEAAVNHLKNKGITVGEVVITSEKALLLSSQEQALQSYRDKGGEMPTDTYLWG